LATTLLLPLLVRADALAVVMVHSEAVPLANETVAPTADRTEAPLRSTRTDVVVVLVVKPARDVASQRAPLDMVSVTDDVAPPTATPPPPNN
jgi:hypothetical protein